VRIAITRPLFDWQSLEDSPTLASLRELLASIPGACWRAWPSIAVAAGTTIRRPNPTWAMLIKRVYEVDPLACPKCGAAMKVISFIEPPRAHAAIRHLLADSQPPFCRMSDRQSAQLRSRNCGKKPSKGARGQGG
jgi:hypothetical protein